MLFLQSPQELASVVTIFLSPYRHLVYILANLWFWGVCALPWWKRTQLLRGMWAHRLSLQTPNSVQQWPSIRVSMGYHTRSDHIAAHPKQGTLYNSLILCNVLTVMSYYCLSRWEVVILFPKGLYQEYLGYFLLVPRCVCMYLWRRIQRFNAK